MNLFLIFIWWALIPIVGAVMAILGWQAGYDRGAERMRQSKADHPVYRATTHIPLAEKVLVLAPPGDPYPELEIEEIQAARAEIHKEWTEKEL